MTACAVAYVPVLHEGYRRFLERHARDAPMFVVGEELYADYRPLAKDIRALPARLTAAAIEAWQICSEVRVLGEQAASELASSGRLIVMPAEDISYRLADRFFARCEVRYDSVFLRWDKTKTVQLLPVSTLTATAALEDAGTRRAAPARGTAGAEAAPCEDALAALVSAAEAAASSSVDWWRQVGAAILYADGVSSTARNSHRPHELSAYAAGDPRSNFNKGVAFELSSAVHAEARLIAEAAREGRSTAGSTIYVTDFPCPPCAKLIAAAGVRRLYFRQGYALLDGQDVLEAAGVEIVKLD
jgi:dCMP deaminase